MDRLKAGLVAILLVVSGCAQRQPQMAWDKPGATDTDRQAAMYECERDLRMSAGTFGRYGYGAEGFAERCMNAKGFYLVTASSVAPQRIAPMTDRSGRVYKPTEEVMCRFPNGARTNFLALDCVEGLGRIEGPVPPKA